MKKYSIAIVGATGIVGLECLKILSERRFPVKELRLFASTGRSINVKGKGLRVNKITDGSFAGMDIAFFAVDGAISRRWAPVAVKSGALVIDKSSAFRMDKNVPLVIPEINADAIKPHHRIIASPNCSTTPLAMVLKPLNDCVGVKRVVVSTYQSVSGAGLQAVQEMEKQASCVLRHGICAQRPFAFNAIPQIDSFCAGDYTGEEVKMINETRKILEDHSIKITATCVRIPVYCGHSESVNIETVRPITVAAVRKLLGKANGIKVIDVPERCIYPMPIGVAGQDDVFVGRIRKDPSARNGIDLWLVSDNLRKGAALNAVQIAEYITKKLKN